jgi:DNA-binding MarR family transcriptional regulator
MRTPRFGDADYVALADFRHRLRGFIAFSEARAKELGLEPQQHQLLLAVRSFVGAPPTIRKLADQLVLKHHSAVELVGRLERRGLVRRERTSADRREVSVCITTRGEEVLSKLTALHHQELRRAGPLLVSALHMVLRAPRKLASQEKSS